MKKLETIEKDGKIVVFINKQEKYCPVCGKTMVFDTWDDYGISFQCKECQLIRFFDFKLKIPNLYPKPKLMVR